MLGFLESEAGDIKLAGFFFSKLDPECDSNVAIRNTANH